MDTVTIWTSQMHFQYFLPTKTQARLGSWEPHKMKMIIQYGYNMKMTNVIKLVHTHTKKNNKIILLEGQEICNYCVYPNWHKSIFCRHTQKKYRASAVHEGPWSGSFKSVHWEVCDILLSASVGNTLSCFISLFYLFAYLLGNFSFFCGNIFFSLILV